MDSSFMWYWTKMGLKVNKSFPKVLHVLRKPSLLLLRTILGVACKTQILYVFKWWVNMTRKCIPKDYMAFRRIAHYNKQDEKNVMKEKRNPIKKTHFICQPFSLWPLFYLLLSCHSLAFIMSTILFYSSTKLSCLDLKKEIKRVYFMLWVSCEVNHTKQKCYLEWTYNKDRQYNMPSSYISIVA